MATKTTSSMRTSGMKSTASGKPAAAGKPVTKGKAVKSMTPVTNKARAKPLKKSKEIGQARRDLDIIHFRQLLIEERKRLEEELEQVRNRSTDMDNALPEEGEGGDEDTADLASAMMDKEMDLSVEDELEDILNQVDRAFQKIEEGTYGVCDVSGLPIPASRLELIPYATLTVECQSLAEG